MGEITIQNIQGVVGRQFHLNRAELLSDRRMAEEVRARHIAMYLCKRLTSHSTLSIARQFGNKDHNCVLHAFRKIERLMKADAELNGTIRKLASQCGGILELS